MANPSNYFTNRLVSAGKAGVQRARSASTIIEVLKKTEAGVPKVNRLCEPSLSTAVPLR